ncbi:uncharacterized protein LOC120187645 [Hibiscus syriacus]|uniref:uncharacterized protein LOC120187645 n=1 Tax=Hibiscus syriacus TaxID=106335 RepID=UPI0019216BD3|nr:uncharacterized protein LOC120187645 [Hibiscus syriacus]
MAAVDGLIRDENGKWIHGLMVNIRITMSALAELWGIWQGMILAKTLGARNLIIEADAKWVIDALKKEESEDIQHETIFKDCEEMKKEGWVTDIKHNWGEWKHCAERLANLTLERDEGTQWLEKAPEELSHLLLADINGVELLRWCTTKRCGFFPLVQNKKLYKLKS